MRALKPVLLTGCVITAAAMLALRGFSPAGPGSVAVVVASQSTNGAGVRFAVLQVTNQGPYRVCLPDTVGVQSRGTSKWVYTPTTNLWIDPGKVTSISVCAPASGTDWRVNVGYYTESPWNRLKRVLPGRLATVQGAELWSPWIAQ